MKVKINLFKKIFLFSLFIIIFTIFLSYVLSISAADIFYISRKKSEIIKIKDTAVKYLRNEDIFEEYVENIRDKEGINIYIENRQNQNSHHRKKPRSRYGNINEGFHVVSLPTNNIMLLVYKENISPVETLFVTTSLSVMGSHRQEVYMLNLITLVGAMLISMFISRIFAKKITDNIGALNRVAQKISHLDFSEKSEIKTSDELKDLSKSINIMAESISSSIEGLNTFVSNASHELKTPIAVINTHAQLLAAEKITEEAERKKYVKVILNESRYMDTLVKDLLLMSKLSASEIKLNKEEFNLCEILKESIEQFEFLELQKDINWKIDCKNIKITGNKKLIKIALNNIIQNSLKYSPENSEINIYEKDRKIFFENLMYIDEIFDTEKLFQPFYRGKNATEIKIEGSGLGLSLIKRIFDIHMIECGVKAENKKFIFWFDILR
ncbi:MAG: histidine kinase dimerization/phospho-acceptor domain-containing protein [Fusobacterium sp.]